VILGPTRILPALALLAALAASPDPSFATERRFGYVYGSSTLNPGSVEVEPWTTLRLGREEAYRGFDQRVEFEAGLTDRLQTAFYLNWTAVSEEVDGVLASESTWKGVSSEWKLKFTDPVADPVGFALYLEPGFGPTEAEVEGKVILDSRRGDWYAAFNAGADHEWEFEADETEREVGIDLDLGIAYSLTPALSAGIEMHSPTTIPAGEEVESSALFAGPVLSYAAESWWTTITVLPQIHAWKGATKDGLALDDHERVEIRILLGFDL
jgi:hypothetical protein